MKLFIKLQPAPVGRRPATAIILFLGLGLGGGCPSKAAEKVWDGGARGDGWADIGNWVGPGVPVPGDDLRFPAGAPQPDNRNDFAAGTIFNRLTFAGAGYTVSGNEVGLTGGIIVSHDAGNTILSLPISVEASQTFNVSLAGANLLLNGRIELGRTRNTILTFDGAGQTVMVGNVSGTGLAIGGGGAIRKNGSGTLYIFQPVTFSGPTTVNAGVLRVDGSMSNSTVTLNAGATLLGTGKVGGLIANAGSIVGPGATSPDIFDSLGDVVLNAGSTLNIRLHGTTAGLNYDQLRVQGTVTLGGTLNVTASFIPGVGQRFTLIENDGDDQISGTFAGLPEGAILTINGRPFQISYGARFGGLGGLGRDLNDVTLEAVPALCIWDAGGGLNKFWTQPQNWVDDVAPLPGDDIQFGNPGGGVLTPTNDFPAGQRFGSIIFAGGRVRLVGNPIAVEDGMKALQSGQFDLALPITLKGGMVVNSDAYVNLASPLTLNSSQTFRLEHADSRVEFNNDTILGSYDLSLDAPFVGGFLSPVVLNGTVSGEGSLIKKGNGHMQLNGTNYCAMTVLEGGALRAQMRSRIYGLTLVNAGATLYDNHGSFETVEVRGGTLWPSIFTTVVGRLRVIEKGSLGIRFGQNPDPDIDEIVSTSVYSTDNQVELNDANLIIDVSASMEIPSKEYRIIRGTTLGNFNGLPEATRVLVNDHVFAITYPEGGVSLIGAPPFYWDGGGSGNLWSTAANWAPDFAPNAGSQLVFPDNVAKVATINDFAAGTSFRSLSFGAASYLVVGNPIRLTEGLYNDFAAGETIISADLIVGGSLECRVSNASRLRLEGGITGVANSVGGYWKKTGTGILRFTGTAPSSQSTMNVEGGELELDKPAGVNAISRALRIGDGSNDVRVTLLDRDQIANSAEVTILNRARLDLNGNNETIGSLLGEGTVSLDGRFGLIRSGRLTVSNGNFGGAIVGEGGLTKIGSDSSFLTLSGVSSFTGPTILSGGTLSVDGVQANSPIRLDGGVLAGRGQVGKITGNLNSVVQPGFNGPAFQNWLSARDVAFNSRTTFRALVTSDDPDFENNQLRVSGSVSLGNCLLDLRTLFVPPVGKSYVIIENDGTDAVAGTFSGLPEGTVLGAPSPNLRWRITYAGGDGNDVVLTLVSIDFQPIFTSINVTNPSPSFRTIRISATAVPHARYDLQTTTNLVNWSAFGAYLANPDGIINIIYSQSSSLPAQLYRLKLRP